MTRLKETHTFIRRQGSVNEKFLIDYQCVRHSIDNAIPRNRELVHKCLLFSSLSKSTGMKILLVIATWNIDRSPAITLKILFTPKATRYIQPILHPSTSHPNQEGSPIQFSIDPVQTPSIFYRANSYPPVQVQHPRRSVGETGGEYEPQTPSPEWT